MHKIITHKQETTLTYKEYEYYFDRYIKQKKYGLKKEFYYEGDLVAIVDIERYKGVNRYIIIPKYEDLISEDSILLQAYRAAKK